ncbi:MAG: hypothetical protein ACI4OW_06620 [Alphaproteobacteria bacterium]
MTTETTTTGNDIIDATQNAVISAAENVSEIIEKTSENIHGHGPFYHNPEFWVGLAFILVVLCLAKPVGKIVHAMLTKRIDNITNRIHEAANLQDDAQKLLSEYEKKFKNAQAEADAILEKSQKEIEFLKKENMAKLEKEMKIKEKEAADRLESSKEKATQEITALASNLTIKAIKTAVTAKLDEKTKDRLIDDSINLITTLNKKAS